jgi:hypothetical protein
MEETQPTVTQSRYYSPVFNAAVFDGPFRIYFAQKDESEALKIYYKMKKNIEFQFSEKVFQSEMNNIMLMIYPDEKTYKLAFTEAQDDSISMAKLGNQSVIGIYSNTQDYNVKPLSQVVASIIQSSNLEFSPKHASMEL